MSHNPYSPPTSKVDDVSLVREPISRPAQIVLAIRLAAIGYVLGLISIAISWDYFSRLQSIGSLIWNQLFSLALLVWIYYKIYVGRNWARITLLVLFVLGAAVMLSRVVMDVLIAAPTLEKVQMAVGMAINLTTLWLLFAPPGSYWFRRATVSPAA